MDQKIADHFADIIALAQSTFQQIEYTIDATPERAILRFQAQHASYKIIVTELFNKEGRNYSYYLLRENLVEAGFDNSPDPRVIRLKYGRIGHEHVGTRVPHLHLADKTQLILTDEMDFPAFVDWLLQNILDN